MKNSFFGIIYKVVNKINEKIYIGMTRISLEHRMKEHIRTSKSLKGGWYFHRALNKYGEESFTWEVIETCDSEEELQKSEKFFIDFYQSYNPKKGYNLTFGGEGVIPTDETRKKISETLTGKTQSPETIEKRFKQLSATCLEKYGVENPANIPGVKEKKINTLMQKYGKIFNWERKDVFTREELIEWHYNQGLTLGEIGAKFGQTPEGISYWMKKHGVKVHKKVVSPKSKEYSNPKNDVREYFEYCLKEKQLLSFSEFGKMTADKKNQKLKRLFNAGRLYSSLKEEIPKVALKPELWESFLAKLC